MKLSDFQYELPKNLIAHNPAERRTGSRLMVVERGHVRGRGDGRAGEHESGRGDGRAGEHEGGRGDGRAGEHESGRGSCDGEHGSGHGGGRIIHDKFENLKNYLNAGDCLVLNDTRVMPARLIGAINAHDNIGAQAEVLLLHKDNNINTPFTSNINEEWEALVRPGRKLRNGVKISFGGGRLNAEITKILPSGHRLIRFDKKDAEFMDALSEIGQIPFPPYIKNSNANPERYQTVYSKEPGSAAAPTAGLHFTDEYLADLKRSGIDMAYLTLHIGAGTFAPVREENITDHHMHSEYYRVSAAAADAVNRVKRNQNHERRPAQPRIVSVGTTSLRTLESIAASDDGTIQPREGWTNIFIYPGYEFKCVDALLTNFHLPGSTLLMLICAFAGYDLAMEAYRQAVESEYRFYSFGDAMLII